MKWITFLGFGLFFGNISFALHAQATNNGSQHSVSGKVTAQADEEPLPGVNVLVKGTTRGTLTDSYGNYELDTPSPSDTLVFSFIGFQTKEVPINGQSELNISLASQTYTGDELVVVGYGTQRREEVTASISSVGSDQIASQAVSNTSEALQGKISGMDIQKSGGQPGEDLNIRIRGRRSINASNDPLIVLDGIPYKGSLNSISPQIIESIDVLKDASATAVYGLRGANGVILIDTKKGVSGNTQVSYDGYFGITEARFLRALYYFNLVRMFGDVHLTLEETQGVEIQASRTPASEIYSQAIIPDLEAAIQDLPDSQEDYGHATKPAAQHLLAKVLLTRGYTGYAGSDDFTRAAQLAESVINDYNFALLDEWSSVFDINNQLHSEAVWSVQFTEGLRANGPWKRFKPTGFLLGLWDREIDVRYEDGFKDVFFANNESSIPEGSNGNPRFSVGDTAINLPGEEVTQAFRDNKPYMVISPEDYTEKLYPASQNFSIRPGRIQTPPKGNWILC